MNSLVSKSRVSIRRIYLLEISGIECHALPAVSISATILRTSDTNFGGGIVFVARTAAKHQLVSLLQH
jgi:hypothetical protein